MNENDELLSEYTGIYSTHLKKMAEKLNEHLAGNFTNEPRIDKVVARAKSPERFIIKARKEEAGVPKYNDPLREIQDQIGARVVTFYLGDVERISTIIDRYYRNIESQILIPDSESEFGYIGKHYILLLPEEVFEDSAARDELPSFFELQIKTLFQHAWSEANHDLGYKPEEILTSQQKRKMAFTAAQAWGADQVFEEIFAEISTHFHSAG